MAISASFGLATHARLLPMNVRRIERYQIFDELASGGMGSVHLGRLVGEGGFRKLVAIKVLHPHFARDPDFRAMFLDEARTVSGIRHPNVVSTLDIFQEEGELFLVMDYVDGPPLSLVLKTMRALDQRIPLDLVGAIACHVLDGLHAAHEAASSSGVALQIVHRDVSPHNVLIGSDGISRVVDFGIATAADRISSTRPGEIKGKLVYMPPEQARGEPVDRRADVFAAGALLFEMLTNRTPFAGANAAEIIFRLMNQPAPSPSSIVSEVPFGFDDIVACALSKRREDRFPDARAMAEAIRGRGAPASADALASWLKREMHELFTLREARVAQIDREATEQAVAAEPRAASTSDAVTKLDRGVLEPAPVIAPQKNRNRVFIAAAALTAAGAVTLGVALRPPADAAPNLSTSRTSDALSSSASTANEPNASDVSKPKGPIDSSPTPSPTLTASVTRNALTGRLPASTGAVATTSQPTSSASAKPLPCCIRVGGHWERYSLSPTCVDNCPAQGSP